MQTVIVGTAALGMTIIMIAGGIDLSVGSVVALVTVVIAMAGRATCDVPAAAGDGRRGSSLGGVCGLFNGGLITGLGVVPFIITLGSLKVFRGLAKWLSTSTAVYIPAEAKAVVVRPDPGDRAGAALAAGRRPGSGSCWG